MIHTFENIELKESVIAREALEQSGRRRTMRVCHKTCAKQLISHKQTLRKCFIITSPRQSGSDRSVYALKKVKSRASSIRRLLLYTQESARTLRNQIFEKSRTITSVIWKRNKRDRSYIMQTVTSRILEEITDGIEKTAHWEWTWRK